MGGVDTVRGIGYQHAHSVLAALDVVADPESAAIRVEGTEDVMDIESLDQEGHITRAKQVKTRDHAYTWGKAELLGVLHRWAALDLSATARFEFVTDGRLGPTGQSVKNALDSAAAGDLEPISALLGVPLSDRVCEVFARCAIRQEQVGVEPVLAEAEREVRTLLPRLRGTTDADLRAREAVDRLFREISVRAGSLRADQRVLTKAEILDIVGGTIAVPREDRWDDLLREEYLRSAGAVSEPAAVVPKLHSLDAIGVMASDEAHPTIAVSALLTGSQYATLSGPTGSGKSTTTKILRLVAAGRGVPVVLTHAESYVAGRLDSLVADGLSAVVGRDLPTVTGRQALDDGSVVIVVDGVSEVPATVRDALADELRPRSGAEHGARVLVAGRDIAALLSVFSAQTIPARYSVAAFERAERDALAHNVLTAEASGGLPPATGLAQAEHALGDAAGNPMLLTMALRLLAAGSDFKDRASLYGGVIEQMATRSGVTDVSVVSAVLGVAYAELLDEGRRYASNYEWQRRIAAACARLEAVGVDADRATVLEAADRSGLVTRVGHTQVRAPVHDSFADYLAGLAHAERLSKFPIPLSAGDEQRLVFAGEIGGVDSLLAAAAVTEVPLASLRLAAYDARPSGDDAPAEVAALLGLLAPRTTEGVRIWRSGKRIVASLVPDQPSAWVEGPEGRELARRWPTAVVAPPNGPLAVATRLWGLAVTRWLTAGAEPHPRTPQSPAEATTAVAAHSRATVVAISRHLEQCFSETAAAAVREAMGPLGLRAVVYQRARRAAADGDYAVVYQASEDIDVRVASEEEAARLQAEGALGFFGGAGGQTGVEWLLRRTPSAAAADRIREAVTRLAGTDWP